MQSNGSSPPYHIERLPINGGVLSALEQLELPASVVDSWARFTEPLIRTMLVARTGTEIAGAAILAGRPLASYLKIGGVWTSDQGGYAGETERALIAHAEQLAWETGCIVVKRECPPLTSPARSTPAPGYLSIQAPQIAAPIPDLAPPVPAGLFKWRAPSTRATVPYMRQTTGFTCGTAALSMVLAHFGVIERPTRAAELDLWRQATTIVACDPYGLAVTASRHGLRPAVTVSTDSVLFLEDLRTEHDRELRRFIQGNFRTLAGRAGIHSETRAFGLDELRDLITAGGVAIVLVDELLVHGQACPHWILIHGMDCDFFIAHDPWTEVSQGESWLDGYDVPLSPSALDRIAWTGEPRYRAMLAFSHRQKPYGIDSRP